MRELVLLSAAVACVAFTIAETKLFEPLRVAVRARTGFLGHLLSCGFCLGHWLALAGVIGAGVRAGIGASAVDLVLSWLVVAWLAGLQWAGMCLLVKWAGK